MRNQTSHRATLNNPAHKHKPQHKSQPQSETHDLPHPQASSYLNLVNLTQKLIDVPISKTVTIVLFISLVSRKIPSQSRLPCLNSQK